jgi:small subunit ribosomal protein S35
MANDDFALDKMGKFNFDDLPTLGHEALARQRELLHYARLVEWELPKLQALRSTYEPPAKDAILRLRSLHYQGEAHPATRKAVLTVKVSDLFESGKLTSEAARRKLLLIAGARWDPLEQQPPDQSSEHGFHLHAEHSQIEKLALASGVGTIKISCERFPHERMNIKWCSDTVDKMLREANENPEAMADVPLDLRHVKAREANRKSFARHDGPSKRDFPAQWLPKTT